MLCEIITDCHLNVHVYTPNNDYTIKYDNDVLKSCSMSSDFASRMTFATEQTFGKTYELVRFPYLSCTESSEVCIDNIWGYSTCVVLGRYTN